MNTIEDYYKNLLLGKPLQSISDIIIQQKNRKEVKDLMPLIIKNAKSYDRIELIKIIRENPELGSLEQYLSDFLWVGHTEYLANSLGLDRVLECLMKREEINKKKLLEEISNNIEGILFSFKSPFSIEILDFLKKIDNLHKNVEKNEETEEYFRIIEKEISSQAERLLIQYNYEFYVIQKLRQFNIDNKILEKHQEDITKRLSGAMLLKYMQTCKGNEEFKQKWNYYDFAYQLLKDDSQIVKDKIAIPMVGKFIEELCKHEKVEILDIECAGEGAYSFSLKIGSFVLKIGKQRATNYIPNHKRIIKPLIRQQTNAEGRKDIPNLFIEIQNAVDANWYKDLSEEKIKEELYKIYRELRKSGIVWNDVKAENVGRLLRPNKENFVIDGEELKSSNYAIGFTGNENEEILQAGELVIIDTDYIFSQEDKNKRIAAVGYHREFEKRWKEEHIDIENENER